MLKRIWKTSLLSVVIVLSSFSIALFSPSTSTVSADASTFCAHYYTNEGEQEACVRGYDEFTTEYRCGGAYIGAKSEACKFGYNNKGKTISMENSPANMENANQLSPAEKACSEQYAGNADGIKACVDGYDNLTTNTCYGSYVSILPGGANKQQACIWGATAAGKTSNDSTTQTPPTGEGSAASQFTDATSCEAAGHNWDEDSGSCKPSDAKSSCQIQGIGFIVCPVVNFLAMLADVAYGFLADSFLSVPIQVTDQSDSNPTYKAWRVFLGVGNAVFIIVFLIIVISQITNMGMSNYGIKVMLPKLIVSALLINLSFFICQLAVDLSNAAGYGAKELFTSLGSASIPAEAEKAGEGIWNGSNGWANIAGSVLAVGIGGATGAAAAGGIGLAFIALVGMLIAGLAALIMIFFILTIRQAAIIMLIAVAPLAFAARLLPNTEGLYKKWQKTFVAMLLVFPIIGLVYGVSSMASQILTSVYAVQGDILGQVVAAGVLTLPLFVVPGLLKKSIDSLGSIGGKIAGFGGKIGGDARKKISDSGLNKHMQAKSTERKHLASLGQKTGSNKNPTNWARNARAAMTRRTLMSQGRLGAALNSATDGYGGELLLQQQAQQRKDAQEKQAMFLNDPTLAAAYVNSGGNLSNLPDGVNLSAAQRAQFTAINRAGNRNKPQTYLAAMSSLASMGKSDMSTVQASMATARANGASNIELETAWNGARDAYKAAGRGDMVGEMDHILGRYDGDVSAISRTTSYNDLASRSTADELLNARATGWGTINPASIHKDGLVDGSTGLAAYERYLSLNEGNVINALTAYDSMGAEARDRAEATILRQANSRGAAYGSINDAQHGYGIRR